MKIKTIKSGNQGVYPATILDAVKDANAKIVTNGIEQDNPTYGKSLREIIASNKEEIMSTLNALNTTINDMSNTLSEFTHVYGVRHFYNESSTALTRIGLDFLHRALPVQSLMKRCILKDDGMVAYYLDANDSTKKEDGTEAMLDGTDGQLMVEVPEHYRRHRLYDSYYDSEISLVPFPNAFKVNKYYISVAEATLDRDNNKLSSVINTATQYRGGDNTASWDGTYRSLLGMPVTNLSPQEFHEFANNRGNGWEMYEADVHDDLYWLYAIEYANTNIQLDYSSELTTGGYHQGGLGAGVTVEPSSSWKTYNTYNPIIPCKATLSLGNNSGIVPYTVLASNGTSIAATEQVPSYRGIQNPYAHIWKWIIGSTGIGSGSNQVIYRCRNRKQYTTNNVNIYYSQEATISISGLNNSGGWGKTIIKNTHGDIIPTSTGAGSATYLSDYVWEYKVNNVTYAHRVGGGVNDGESGGLSCLCAIDGFTTSSTDQGTRLIYCASDYIVEDSY